MNQSEGSEMRNVLLTVRVHRQHRHEPKKSRRHLVVQRYHSPSEIHRLDGCESQDDCSTIRARNSKSNRLR